MRHIIFWQTMPSPHMAGLIRCLGQRENYSVSAIFSGYLSDERKNLGWHDGSYGNIPIRIKPEAVEVQQLLNNTAAHTIHIFSGINYDHFLRHWYLHLTGAGARVGILSEGRFARGFTGYLKRIDRHLREFPRLQHADFILAIGRVGRLWYGNRGLRPPVYDFGYVVDPCPEDKPAEDPLPVAESRANGRIFRIIFVGRLLDWKAADHLLKAVSRFTDPNWQLKIIGHGPELPRLQKLVRTLKLDSYVEFLGALDNGLTRCHIREADVMAFPSIGDGWGAVVNEALLCGTPVVCTDYIGASDLIQQHRNGSLYPRGDIAALWRELLHWRTQMQQRSEVRASICESARSISPAVTADYLAAVLDHAYQINTKMPVAPWRNHTERVNHGQ